MSSIIQRKKVMFLALSGIGNLLMQLPTITTLKKAKPDWHITVWVAPRGTKALAQSVPEIDHVIEGKMKRSLLGHSLFIYQLSKNQPDIAIMLSPGQRTKGAAYMYLMGAKQRVAHRYPHLGNHTSAFLLTDGITEKENLHDIEQNLNLLAPLEIPVEHLRNQPYHFHPPQNNVAQAQQIVSDLNIPVDKKIIGFHAGCSPEFLWKRWPLERFAEVAREVVINNNAHILIFGGPEENQQKKDMQRLIGKKHASLISANLVTTAAVMQHCTAFLANDSGLMHLSAASGVPTWGIFGPTDENKTGPRGPHSHTIRARLTKPVYNTEYNFSFGNDPHETLLQVSSEIVAAALKSKLH